MFHFVPFYSVAIYGLFYPAQDYMSDWGLIHAGAAAQVCYIASNNAIATVLDITHLLISCRLNLLTSDLRCTIERRTHCACLLLAFRCASSGWSTSSCWSFRSCLHTASTGATVPRSTSRARKTRDNLFQTSKCVRYSSSGDLCVQNIRPSPTSFCLYKVTSSFKWDIYLPSRHKSDFKFMYRKMLMWCYNIIL